MKTRWTEAEIREQRGRVAELNQIIEQGHLANMKLLAIQRECAHRMELRQSPETRPYNVEACSICSAIGALSPNPLYKARLQARAVAIRADAERK